IRYDLSSDRRDLVWNGVTTQVLGTLTGGTHVGYCAPPKMIPPPRGQLNSEPTDAELGITRSPQTTGEARTTLPTPPDNDVPPGVELSPARPHRGHFNLGVFTVGRRQPLLARLSLRSLRANGFLAERYVGDYLFDSSQRATFVRGLNPGDRMVVRFFDTQGRQFVGYSEFELLDDFAAVNLVVNPALGSVRTVMGENRDRSGVIDRGTTVWDYWTQLEGFPSSDLERVTVRFFDQAPEVDLGSFVIAGLPRPERRSVLPRSFTDGSFALIGRSIPVLRRDLETPLLTLPNQTIPIIRVGGSTPTYEVISQILRFRDLTLDKPTRRLP
ncbi:MAG: hypothetical protein HC919_09290, partial [Oscillatoriales cyanobacterium SM2_2_1]|nr:hypothetical protein [Oscillatoriales cyanobacterium SM2_2_1]